MKSIILAICFSVVAMWTAPSCRAHGVYGAVESLEGYCVTARYDDGEPMSYAAVEIKAPDSDRVFQKGRTDRNGCFMFRPDGGGHWQAIVQDGMGHRLALAVAVGGNPGGSEKVRSGISESDGRQGRFRPIITGLAIIFGLCGLLYGWRARSRLSMMAS